MPPPGHLEGPALEDREPAAPGQHCAGADGARVTKPGRIPSRREDKLLWLARLVLLPKAPEPGQVAIQRSPQFDRVLSKTDAHTAPSLLVQGRDLTLAPEPLANTEALREATWPID